MNKLMIKRIAISMVVAIMGQLAVFAGSSFAASVPRYMEPGFDNVLPARVTVGQILVGMNPTSDADSASVGVFIKCYTDSALASGDVVSWHRDDTTTSLTYKGRYVSQSTATNFTLAGVALDTAAAGDYVWVQVEGYNSHILVGATTFPVNSILLPTPTSMAANINPTGRGGDTTATGVLGGYIRAGTGNNATAGFIYGTIHSQW